MTDSETTRLAFRAAFTTIRDATSALISGFVLLAAACGAAIAIGTADLARSLRGVPLHPASQDPE